MNDLQSDSIINAIQIYIANDQDLSHELNVLVEKADMDAENLAGRTKDWLQEKLDESEIEGIAGAIAQSAINHTSDTEWLVLAEWGVDRYRQLYC